MTETGTPGTPRESELADPPPCEFRGGDCTAVAAAGGLCLQHLEPTLRGPAIEQVLAGDSVDLRNLRIDAELWDSLADGLERVAFDGGRRATIWLSDTCSTP